MKLKPDENLPESLRDELAALSYDVDHVRSEGLAGRDDPDVWAAAQVDGRFFITQDLDFSDVRMFCPGTHCGLSLARLPDAGRMGLTRQVVDLLRRADARSWSGCFLVLSGHKVRALHPKEA